jgi:hypothetical protein
LPGPGEVNPVEQLLNAVDEGGLYAYKAGRFWQVYTPHSHGAEWRA